MGKISRGKILHSPLNGTQLEAPCLLYAIIFRPNKLQVVTQQQFILSNVRNSS